MRALNTMPIIAAYDHLAASLQMLRIQQAWCCEHLPLNETQRRRITQAHHGIEAVIGLVDDLLALAHSEES
jgi:hypothetical protein